jgi:hypothetical protein
LIQGESRPDWNQLTAHDKKALVQIAKQSSAPATGKETEISLLQYGLLCKKNSHISIAGELLQKWLLERTPAMPSADIAPYVPIIVEATKFVFDQTGKWIDDIRKKASGSKAQKTKSAPPARPIPSAKLSNTKTDDVEEMAKLMDRAIAEMSASEIESLVVQIKTHRKNLNRLETKKAKYGLNVPNQIENEIEDEADAIIVKMEHLENLLANIYNA